MITVALIAGAFTLGMFVGAVLLLSWSVISYQDKELRFDDFNQLVDDLEAEIKLNDTGESE
jgi:hypothetical protein